LFYARVTLFARAPLPETKQEKNMLTAQNELIDTQKVEKALPPKKRWATGKMMPEIYPGIVTESGLRWMIFNEFQNGFCSCIRRLGGKVLIDLDAFESWVESSKREHYPGPKRPSWK
jgi:hypothetical protein